MTNYGKFLILLMQVVYFIPLFIYTELTCCSSVSIISTLLPDLWLCADGSRPTRSFFIQRMRVFFTNDIGGQSMHTRGATSLTENGVPPHLIQAIGRWGPHLPSKFTSEKMLFSYKLCCSDELFMTLFVKKIKKIKKLSSFFISKNISCFFHLIGFHRHMSVEFSFSQ